MPRFRKGSAHPHLPCSTTGTRGSVAEKRSWKSLVCGPRKMGSSKRKSQKVFRVSEKKSNQSRKAASVAETTGFHQSCPPSPLALRCGQVTKPSVWAEAAGATSKPRLLRSSFCLLHPLPPPLRPLNIDKNKATGTNGAT